MFAYSEAEVASCREVTLLQFVFLDFETALENFLCLWAANGDMNSNLFITTDTECSDSIASLACTRKIIKMVQRQLSHTTHTVNWCLTAQLFQHFSRTSKSVTRFTDGDVENEFLDAQLLHGVGRSVFAISRLQRALASRKING